METIQHIFNFPNEYPLHTDRFNKIEELKKPVYNKKIRERRKILSLPKYQFVKTIFSGNNNVGQRNIATKIEDKKIVRKSKSELCVRKNKISQQQKSSFKNNLGINLIIEKLDYKKDRQASLPQKKKNSFKTIFQLIASGISDFPVTKNTAIRIDSQTHTLEQKQNLTIIDIGKKGDLQSDLVNHLGQLRKKRNSFCQSQLQAKGQSDYKFIPRNSLFFMNHLKQIQKRHQTQKSPHINNDTNAIKIQQHIAPKKILLSRESSKNTFKTNLHLQKLKRQKSIFNSMKIQPW